MHASVQAPINHPPFHAPTSQKPTARVASRMQAVDAAAAARTGPKNCTSSDVGSSGSSAAAHVSCCCNTMELCASTCTASMRRENSARGSRMKYWSKGPSNATKMDRLSCSRRPVRTHAFRSASVQ